MRLVRTGDKYQMVDGTTVTDTSHWTNIQLGDTVVRITQGGSTCRYGETLVVTNLYKKSIRGYNKDGKSVNLPFKAIRKVEFSLLDIKIGEPEKVSWSNKIVNWFKF